MLAHLCRAGCAVEADRVDAEGVQRDERRTDFGAEQHRACGLYRHVHENRKIDSCGFASTLGPDHRCLRLQEILRGLDEDRIDAAANHRLHLLAVGVTDRIEANVAECGQLGTGTDRAEHEARFVGVFVGCSTRDACRGLRQLLEAVDDVVFGQRSEVRTEGVRLDRVGAGIEIRAVDLRDDVRTRDVENLVASFESLEIHLQREVRVALQHGAHRPIGDEHAVTKDFTKLRHEGHPNGLTKVGVRVPAVRHATLDECSTRP